LTFEGNLKRFGLFLLFFIFLSSAVWGESYTWTGGGSDDKWTTAANWKDSSDGTTNHPGNTAVDTAVINNGTVEIEASDTITIASLTINGGTLTIESAGESAGHLTTTDLTIDDATITNNSGSLTVTNVTITSTNGIVSGLNISSGNVSITTTGNNNVTIGAIPTSGTINLTVNGAGTLNAGSNTYGTVTINADVSLASNLSTGNLTINSGETLNLASHNITATGTITNNGTLVLGASTVTANTINNGGTLTLDGNTSQLSGGTHTTVGGTVEFTGSGTTLSGITHFTNLIINGGTHTGAGAISVSGNFQLNGGSLGATSLAVTGSSTIGGNITTSGTQQYGAVMLGNNVTLTGSTVTLGAITGGNHSLTISGDAVFNGGISGINALHITGAVNNATISAAITATASVSVDGTSTISADITTTGAQSYTGTVTITGTQTLKTTGGTITTTGLVTATAGVTIEASGGITIGSGGITASTGTSGVVRLESGGNITVSGHVKGHQLLAITPTGIVTVGVVTIDASNTESEGLAAAIYIKANSFHANGGANSIELEGTDGEMCLNLASSWTDSASAVVGGTSRWHEHISKHLIYGVASAPYYDRNGDPISNYTYVNSSIDTGIEFDVDSGYNIYIFNVGNNSKEVTFTVPGSGLIEIHGVYESTELTLHPGSGGLHFVGAKIELTGGDFSTTDKLTLFGLSNSIKAEGITLKEVEGSGNLTLEATTGYVTTIDGNVTTSGNQTYNGAVTITGTRVLKSTGGTITTTTELVSASAGVTIEASGGITIGSGGINAETAGVIRLESTGGNITVSGAVTGHQLLAITQNGSVTVDVVTISGNNGSEHDNAAIYVKAVSFSATGGANSITPGGAGGQLCLWINEEWSNPDDAVPAGRWHQHIPKILYSFTEDENGDGRLDRIRVQTNVPLNGNFSGFNVSVEGYEVKGFAMVSNSAPNNDSFYINLEQKSELDGGSTPRWRVTRNQSLKDSTNTSFMGNPSTDRNITPTDTIPPRIAYTLALPGHNQIYVQMSEPVDSTATELIDSFEIDVKYTITGVIPIGSHGYLLDLDDSFDINDLVKSITSSSHPLIGFFSVKDITDRSTEPTIDPSDPPPKYPTNWGYTYTTTSINFPHSLIDSTNPVSPVSSVIRRVTDVLVSRSPDNYFALPVFAKNEKGTIWVFDGTASLEAGESVIELQARINTSPALTGTYNLQLFYKKTARGNSNALWQPFSSQYYFAPDGGAILSPTPPPSSPLYNFDFGNIDSGNRVEFYLYIGTMYGNTPNTDQFIARLDIKSGAAIPSNWYNLVRPFCFDVQGVRRQRGGVTIRNNVINSDAREEVTILYNLARPGRVTIQLYTLEGTLVKSLMRNEYREAGEFDVKWNGSNNAGRAVARGMYFVRVVGPDIDEIRKIMVIR
jgi:hypothetical protein